MPEGRCPHCQATGKLRWARGHMVFSKSCAACGGTGRQRSNAATPAARTAGWCAASRCRYACRRACQTARDCASPERGHAGRRGGRTGDLFIDRACAAAPAVPPGGRRPLLTVPVAVHEAALGARIEVPTLDGPAQLRVPPGTQAGQRFRLRGPRRADGRRGAAATWSSRSGSCCRRSLDERSKELLREFGRMNARRRQAGFAFNEGETSAARRTT